MAEEEGGEPKYIFITENGEQKTTSIGYTSKALAKYPNGDTFEGYYIDGIREGRGIYRYASTGEKYDGEWIKNLKHGIGRMSYMRKGKPNGEYNGFWENGRRHGEGVMNYANGDVYSGWWKFGEKEGTGTYTAKATGMKLFGEWTAGQMTKGRWVYPNGMYFEGSFENNKPKGEGVWVFKNGNRLEGTYEQKPKGAGEEEEAPPEEEDEEAAAANASKKPKVDLLWHSHTNITESAHKINSVEQ